MADEIELNGEIYILKKSIKEQAKEAYEQIEFNPYNLKDEAKIHLKLSKILLQKVECISELAALNKTRLLATNPNAIISIEAKSYRARAILRRYISREGEEEHIPTINYDATNSGIATALFQTESLKKIIEFFDIQEDVLCRVHLIKDYPVRIANGDWEVHLAPRVENE